MLIEHSTQQLMAINFESPFQQVLQQQRPLLKSLNKAKKWQLWLSTRPMLKRSWVNIAGLDKNKVVHLANLNNANLISTIEKALQNKTCSYVVACINNLNEQDKARLQQAVSSSDTCLLLVHDKQIVHDEQSEHPIQYH
jgi:cell division inhibitor SulA